MDEVAPGVFVGGALSKMVTVAYPQINGHSTEHLHVYDSAEVDAVLSLRVEHSDVFLPGKIKAYLWLPIDDAPPFPGIEWLTMAVLFVERCRTMGLSVLIHCAAGVSRSGLVAVAYVMKSMNLTLDEAMNQVCSKRPCVRPNSAFVEGLREYEATIQFVTEAVLA